MARVNKSAVRFGAYVNGNHTGVATVDEARVIASKWLERYEHRPLVSFGLPEVDDRYAAWRVPLLDQSSDQQVGEIMVSCRDGAVLQATDKLIISRRLNIPESSVEPAQSNPIPSQLVPSGADVLCGNSMTVLKNVEAESLHLMITSPPYFNARPQYSEHTDYKEYLGILRDVFQQCHRVLSEGRFFVVNASPVLLRRAKRSASSKRIPVPFHINTIVEEIGFDFVDDIIWAKPEGAGWNTGRGRRFAADRHPLQYKPVPVTEYFLVYRKHTDKLIDWNIRKHPDQEVVKASKVADGYEVTNLWRERPANHPVHPAVFPESLIRKFIQYYSFRGDIVLDPFAGIGTVGHAAKKEGRGFFLVDINEQFCQIMNKELL